MTVGELDERALADALEDLTGAPRRDGRTGGPRDHPQGCRIQVDLRAREVYSYGRHFPLFRYLPREGRRRALFVINGDASSGGGFWRSSRTPTHQSAAREAIRATGAASVVIPFSALAGAGIDVDSVRLIHARPDAEWTETRTAEALQAVPKWQRLVWTGDTTGGPLYRDRARDDDGLYRWEVRIHRLGDALFSAVRDGRRARYLSSFDTNESPPLYFLAECPRGCGATVDSALDSLAPRAVHAALARGRDVRRQGDIFLIATDLTDLEVELRTVTRARLTQWTRDARARKGEVCFQPKLTVSERRAMIDDARDEWRRIFRPLADAAAGRDIGVIGPDRRAAARELSRARWQDLRRRQEGERAAADAAAVDYDSPISLACSICYAPAGAACESVTIESGRVLDCRGAYGSGRTLAYQHSRAVDELRRASRARAYTTGAPETSRGARRRWAKIRAEHARDVADARDALYGAVFGRAPASYYARAHYRESVLKTRRRSGAASAMRARAELEVLLANGPRDSMNNSSRAHGRDDYRRRYGNNAAAAWVRAMQSARARAMPQEFDVDTISRRRETVRRALAVYGTAHTATEVVRARNGAVYVRGTVSHVPELEPGRRGNPDHARVFLAPGVWYLAVRNTVPRQSRRRARAGAA